VTTSRYNASTQRWEIIQDSNLIAEAETQWAADQVVAVALVTAPNPYVEPLVTAFVAPSQQAIDSATGSTESLPPGVGTGA